MNKRGNAIGLRRCRLRATFIGALALTGSAVADAPAASVTPPVHVICTPQPLICTTIAAESNDRFQPLVQHLLVRQQLESQPRGWQMIYIYLPTMDPRALEELQIRFLDELLQRKRAADAAEEKETSTEK